MKNIIPSSLSTLLLAGALLNLSPLQAQRVEVTNVTTTTEGTISDFGPQAIQIKTAPGFQPVRYISNETTNYVDEAGNPIAAGLVKSGLPVTIYYTKVGDTLIASKVMVRSAAVAPVQIVETVQTTTTFAGILDEFGSETFYVQGDAATAPLSYTYGKTTTYVDETGAPVSISTVRSGLPVTVHYTHNGSTLMATKVIVQKAAVAPVIVVPAP